MIKREDLPNPETAQDLPEVIVLSGPAMGLIRIIRSSVRPRDAVESPESELATMWINPATAIVVADDSNPTDTKLWLVWDLDSGARVQFRMLPLDVQKSIEENHHKLEHFSAAEEVRLKSPSAETAELQEHG